MLLDFFKSLFVGEMFITMNKELLKLIINLFG